jgi:uncharacterized protein
MNNEGNLISKDEKLMALLSHLSIFIPNMGILAPIVIWVINKEKSSFIRFNALQAIFFQLIFLAIMMFFIFIGVIFMLISIPWTNLNSNAAPGPLFFLSMVFMFMYFPLWIIFGIFAVIASVKSYNGNIFKYAIIGKIIEKKVYSD